MSDISFSEKEIIIKQAIEDAYCSRKNKEYLGTEGLSYPMYDYLYWRKILSPSELERQYLKEEAKDYLKEFFEEDDITESEIVNVAKTFAVRDYFNELIEKNIENIF